MAKTLGIESTAHTLGIGICDGERILSNERALYKPINEGIIPRKAADHHAEKYLEVLSSALVKAGCSLSDIDLFAFSQGPGIGQCLRISCAGSKYLAAKYKKPIMGVNHCVAHIEISKKETGIEDPVVLYVSGGNTQVIVGEKKGKGGGSATHYRVLGETLDIGVGNLFDNFAREIGEEYGHGSVVARLAESGKYVEMPYTVKGMNFAFSGLLTFAGKLAQTGKHTKEDLCHSVMETAFAELCEATERALCLSHKKGVIVCGGVAQNTRLQGMLKAMCKEHGVRFGVAAGEFNADNGAMIAYTGALKYGAGKRLSLSGAKPRQDWRVDEE